MTEKIISVKKAVKIFKEHTVLNDVSLELEKGKIYGIVGRNGSGKTVLFKCICGFMPLTSGEISVNGKIVGKEENIPKDIGVIIETPGFIPNYSGYKNLSFLASINKKIKKDDILETLRIVGLDSKSKKHVGKYSLGMRQRLGIAQAIMENPDILILDEPMNGLDNDGVQDMRKLFLNLKEQGKTILLASHNREDIQVLCDEVYEMDKGNLRKSNFSA
jgi:ABC-2 type transport system ATP-binding protein